MAGSTNGGAPLGSPKGHLLGAFSFTEAPLGQVNRPKDAPATTALLKAASKAKAGTGPGLGATKAFDSSGPKFPPTPTRVPWNLEDITLFSKTSDIRELTTCASCAGKMWRNGMTGNRLRLKCGNKACGKVTFVTGETPKAKTQPSPRGALARNKRNTVLTPRFASPFSGRKKRAKGVLTKGELEVEVKKTVQPQESPELVELKQELESIKTLIREKGVELERVSAENTEFRKKFEKVNTENAELHRELKTLKESIAPAQKGKVGEKPKNPAREAEAPKDKVGTEKAARPTQEKVEKNTVVVKPTRPDAGAWKGSSVNPSQLMQMVRGRAVPVKEAPQPKEKPPATKKVVIITEQGIRNFKEGKTPGHQGQGLATVYIRGIARTSYKSMRAVLVKLGIQSKWVRNLAFIGANILELLVFSERAEEVVAAVVKDSTALQVDRSFDPLAGGKSEVKQAVARLERNLTRLPEEMHMVRKELTKKLQAARSRLQTLEKGNETSLPKKESVSSPGCAPAADVTKGTLSSTDRPRAEPVDVQ